MDVLGVKLSDLEGWENISEVDDECLPEGGVKSWCDVLGDLELTVAGERHEDGGPFTG